MNELLTLGQFGGGPGAQPDDPWSQTAVLWTHEGIRFIITWLLFYTGWIVAGEFLPSANQWMGDGQ